MENNETKTIQIVVAGRSFPVKVTKDEEVVIRNLETEINGKILEFQKMYPMRDKLDCVIMTMLTYTYDLQNKKDDDNKAQINYQVDSLLTLLKDI